MSDEFFCTSCLRFRLGTPHGRGARVVLCTACFDKNNRVRRKTLPRKKKKPYSARDIQYLIDWVNR